MINCEVHRNLYISKFNYYAIYLHFRKSHFKLFIYINYEKHEYKSIIVTIYAQMLGEKRCVFRMPIL